MTDRQGFINAKFNARTKQIEVPLVPVNPRDATSKSYVDALVAVGGPGGTPVTEGGTWNPGTIVNGNNLVGGNQTNQHSVYKRIGTVVVVTSSYRFQFGTLNGGSTYQFTFPIANLPFAPDSGDYAGVATLAVRDNDPTPGPVLSIVSRTIAPGSAPPIDDDVVIILQSNQSLSGSNAEAWLRFTIAYETS